jgi:hypothetical protein
MKLRQARKIAKTATSNQRPAAVRKALRRIRKAMPSTDVEPGLYWDTVVRCMGLADGGGQWFVAG